MSDQDGGSWKASTRGEQAWKEATDAVAARNAETRRAGKQEREERDEARDRRRKDGAARRHAALLKRRGS